MSTENNWIEVRIQNTGDRIGVAKTRNEKARNLNPLKFQMSNVEFQDTGPIDHASFQLSSCEILIIDFRFWYSFGLWILDFDINGYSLYRFTVTAHRSLFTAY